MCSLCFRVKIKSRSRLSVCVKQSDIVLSVCKQTEDVAVTEHVTTQQTAVRNQQTYSNELFIQELREMKLR